MARTIRNKVLDNRTSRFLLPEKQKHWQSIGDDLSLGYRRSAAVSSWYARIRHSSKEVQKVIAEADDYKDANGETVLTYKQASELAVRMQNKELLLKADYTVAQATADYLDWYVLNGNRGVGGKDLKGIQGTINHHIIPTLGDKKVADLTTKALRKWHSDLALAPATLRGGKAKEMSDPRKRKATANRILTILKSALNLAYREEMTVDDNAWRRVKPFAKVDQPKIRYLTSDESIRFINACNDDLRPLSQAALMTGARYGELSCMKVGDFNADSKSVYIEPSKSGKARHIPLTDDAVSFFQRIVAGKLGNQQMFTYQGEVWAKSNQTRPVKQACQQAKICPPISFHILRHTYASHLVMSGVPLEVVSNVLGHADVRTTYRHYAHLAPSFVSDAVRANMPTLGDVATDNVVGISSKV